MKKFLLIPLAVILISGLIFSGCAQPTPAPTPTPTPTPEVKTLKIGGSMPLSGPPSAAGIAWKQGWELAVEKINKEGGLKIGGDTYMLELLVEDSKASAEGGTTVATKLCYEEGVKFMMGDITDFMIPPIYKVTSEAGALFCESLITTSAAVPGNIGDVGPDKPLLIRMALTTDEVWTIPIQYLAKNYPNVKTVGLLALAFPNFDAFATTFASDCAPLGWTVSPDYERFPPDLVDFVPLVTRLMGTKPDAIIDVSSTLSQFPLIVKVARDLGFNGPVVFPLPCDPLYAGEVMPNLSDVITCGFTMDDPNLPDEVKEVIALGRAKFGKDLIEDSIFSYDQVMLLAQMMVKAQSVDPQKVQDTFETLTAPGSLHSIFGSAYAGGLKTTGVNRVLVRPNPMSRLVNGKSDYLGMFSVDIP
jgi:branched-chain amino acid transport system substrate-binding protein